MIGSGPRNLSARAGLEEDMARPGCYCRGARRDDMRGPPDILDPAAPDLRRWGCIALLALTACGAEPGPSPRLLPEGPLLDPARWVAAPAEADPIEDRPAEVTCPAGGFGAEATVFEVETQICSYLTATQPLPAALPAGARLESVVWHLALVADPPAEAHVALRVGPHTLFDARIPTPTPEAVYPVAWTIPEDLPAGTPVYFHLHNHGYNSYRLGPVEAKQ